LIQDPASEEDDDFEVVPQDHDDDTDMWDAEGENEDEAKQAKIRSTSFSHLNASFFSMTFASHFHQNMAL